MLLLYTSATLPGTRSKSYLYPLDPTWSLIKTENCTGVLFFFGVVPFKSDWNVSLHWPLFNHPNRSQQSWWHIIHRVSLALGICLVTPVGIWPHCHTLVECANMCLEFFRVSFFNVSQFPDVWPTSRGSAISSRICLPRVRILRPHQLLGDDAG